MERRWGKIIGALAVIGSMAAWILTVNWLQKNVEPVYQFEEVENIFRAIKTTENGMVLINGVGAEISEYYETIEKADLEADLPYLRYTCDGKIGYLNSETGDIMIPARFVYAEAFQRSVGCALVGDGNEKWFVDSWGRTVSEKYEDAGPFEHQESLAKVKKDGQWGIISARFKYVLPCEFDSLGSIPAVSSLMTGIRNGVAVVIRTEEQKFTELPYCAINDFYGDDSYCYVTDKDGKMAIADWRGELLSETLYDEIATPSNGVIAVKQEEKYGAVGVDIINRRYYEMIPTIYDRLLKFNEEGFAPAQKDGLWGLVDLHGNWTELAGVDTVREYASDMAAIHTEDGWGFVNGTGEIVIAPQYEIATDFTTGMSVCSNENGNTVFDSDGKEVFHTIKDEIIRIVNGQYMVVKNGDFCRILRIGTDQDGEYHTTQVLSEVLAFDLDEKDGFDGYYSVNRLDEKNELVWITMHGTYEITTLRNCSDCTRPHEIGQK